jgi:CBS domain-containing protein
VEEAAIDLGDARLAEDLMLRDPKTLPADATVAEVRAQLASPKVQMVVLADGELFAGALVALPDTAAADERAIDYAEPNPPTIAPDASATSAFEQTAASPNRRVLVVDEERRLLGLLCLNAARTGFCQTSRPS